MPSLNRPAKACELASFSLNETGPAPSADVSNMTVRLTHAILVVIAWRPRLSRTRPQHLADIVSAGSGHFFGRTKTANKINVERQSAKKGAAVAGGSKVITGRRQTEWTGATRRPEAGRLE